MTRVTSTTIKLSPKDVKRGVVIVDLKEYNKLKGRSEDSDYGLELTPYAKRRLLKARNYKGETISLEEMSRKYL